MRILYLAESPAYHVVNDLVLFKQFSHETLVVNAQFTAHQNPLTPPGTPLVNLYGNSRFVRGKGFETIVAKVALDALGRLRDQLSDIVRRYQPDLIYSAWSSGVLPEISSLLKLRLRIPVVHRLIMYPSLVPEWLIKLENTYSARILPSVSGIITATEEMWQYIHTHVHVPDAVPHLVFWEYLSSDFYSKQRLPLLSQRDGEPHLLFLGHGDFSRTSEDLLQQLLQISAQGVHIHLFNYKGDSRHNEYLHGFSHRRFETGELATFASQFDATLMTYDRSLPLNSPATFKNSPPNRFTAGIASAIPILMPTGILPTFEKFLSKHQLGLCYGNAVDLRTKLLDMDLMKGLRTRIHETKEQFSYEKHWTTLERFLKEVLEKRK